VRIAVVVTISALVRSKLADWRESVALHVPEYELGRPLPELERASLERLRLPRRTVIVGIPNLTDTVIFRGHDLLTMLAITNSDLLALTRDAALCTSKLTFPRRT
jgi:hypothetical protein